LGAVYFYHMTRTPLQATLPVLLQKSLEQGWRVAVRGPDGAQLAHLDESLWLSPEEGFLPHGMDGGAHDARQPVLLGTQVGIEGREALICLGGAAPSPEEVNALERASILFDGQDGDAVQAAREQWRALTGAGCKAQYWSQESGRWEKKAEA